MDGDVSRALDLAAEGAGYSSSELATRLVREGLERRYRAEIAEGMTWAGVGTVALTCILLLPLLMA